MKPHSLMVDISIKWEEKGSPTFYSYFIRGCFCRVWNTINAILLAAISKENVHHFKMQLLPPTKCPLYLSSCSFKRPRNWRYFTCLCMTHLTIKQSDVTLIHWNPLPWDRHPSIHLSIHPSIFPNIHTYKYTHIHICMHIIHLHTQCMHICLFA